ncbi:MAG: SusC/RagA family TonB-linked outer membrane protein [Tannerella sp.]|nr:SusC/RagA family TonB-linked outer membrane protein [Tannerella sp.]
MINKLIEGMKHAGFEKLKRVIMLSVFLLMAGTGMMNASDGNPPETDEPQQAKTRITGTVVDRTGEPVIGANIVEKGVTANGTVTDVDGKFSLEVSPEATLLVSFIGYVTQEVAAGDQANLKIVLQEDTQLLDEVIVIGYGTARRREYTGSVGSVKLENSPLATLPNLNIMESLKGNISGMNVGGINSSGGEPDLLIRGQNSINGDNKPLIILDGVIFMGNISDINPNDIANIDVLKDAVSSAVYGSRSANGVIAITSKKGRVGKPMISFHAATGINTWANNRPKMADGPHWLEDSNVHAGREKDDITRFLPEITDLIKKGEEKEMLDYITHTGNIQSYQIAVSGGTKELNYYLSTSYESNNGVLIGDEYDRISVMGKIGADITNWLNIGADAGFSRRDYSGVAASYGFFQSYPDGLYWVNFREIDPATTLTQQATHPLWGVDDGYRDNVDLRHNIRLNAYATVKIPWIEGLSYKINFLPSMDLIKQGDFAYETNFQNAVAGPFTPEKLQSFLTQANGSMLNSRNYNYVFDNILSYSKRFGKHSIDATLVATRDYEKYEVSNFTGSDFLANGNTALGLGGLHKATVQKMDLYVNSKANGERIGGTVRTNIGYLGRIQYGLNDRYFFQASWRRDGASVFGSNRKWGSFGAAGASWNISDEKFLKAFNPLNSLKLKANFGQNGNQGLTPYAILARVDNGNIAGNFYEFSDTQGKVYYSIVQSALGNNNMGWEKTTGIDYGFESAWLNNRLMLDASFYHSKTTDQIFERTIPSMTGFNKIYASMGQVNNSGVEATLKTVNITDRDWTWSTFVTFWKNNNKLIHLYGDDLDGDGKEDDDISDPNNALIIGKSLGVIYGYRQVGITQEDDTEYMELTGTQPGNPKYDDMVDGVPGISPDDRTILGYRKENFRLNFGTTLRYRDFELYALAVGIFGGNNRYLDNNELAYRHYQEPRRILDEATYFNRPYWTPENRNNTYPIISFRTDGRYQGLQSRTWVRIQDISLSYNFNETLLKSLHVQNLKLYLAAKNVALFTGWFGGDPEIGSRWMDGTFPVTASYTIGLNLGF